MMRWIVGLSMRLQYLVIILAAVLMLFGVVELREMPVDVFPEFNPPLVEIQTEALGLSAAEMEALITVPLEADLLNGVAWLDQIYSESVAGLSSILLVFEEGTDPIRARQMVQERLTQTFALPNVSSPPTMLQPLSTSNRLMMVGLSSSELSLIDMSVLARWTIKPRLLGVPGVANVAIWGQREWQLQVQVDPERLHDQGVSLQQVIETTGEALWVSPLPYLESSTPGTAGWIDTPNQRLGIQHLLPIASADELAQVAVVDHEGLRLGDVADVVEDHQPLIGDALLNDGPGLILVIEKFPNANTLEVTRGVEEAFQALRPGLTGIDIDTTLFRPANYIEQATSNLSTLVVAGAVLLVLVLGAFFFGWRTALISLVVIPVSLITATFVLYLRGATFNTMLLAGLVMALGVIIDDAIIDVENIARRLRQQRQEGSDTSTESIILEAALEMRGPLTFALLIILLAVVPVFVMQGLAGSFFEPLAVSYALAVLVSLAVALIVTPALSLILLGNARLTNGEPPLVRALQGGYNRILASVVHAPYPAIAAATVIILVGLAMFLFLEQSLLPSFQQTELRIEWEAAPGTGRTEMIRITAQVTSELQAIPGVRNVGSHVGRAITGDQVVGINSGEIWISLDPSADYDATLAEIREVIEGYPGLSRNVQAYEPERLGEVLTGPDKDVVVRVYGHDLDVLSEKAEEVRQVVAGVGGVINAETDVHIEEAQVEIEVDLAAAERHQIKPGDVRRAATTLLSGLQVGNLYEEQKVFEVMVWGVPEIRNSLTDVSELLIDTPGGQVRLGDLADIRIVPTPIVIKRDAVQRFIDIGANVDGRDLGAVVADIESGLAGIAFPLEYHAEILGESLDQQATQRNMLAVTATVVVGIFLLLQAAFTSWRLAFITIATLPVAVAGGLVAAVLGGGVLSLGSLFGFLTVLGIAVRNGILTTNHFQRLEEQEGETFGTELVLRGARERLAPILMTALATGLALLPFVIVGGIAGNEILHPMAVVILGGLVTTMLLDLFILPTLYLHFVPSAERAAASSQMSAQPGLETA